MKFFFPSVLKGSVSHLSPAFSLPPKRKKKRKSPYFCPLANATAVGKKVVVQNVVHIQVSEEPIEALSEGCVDVLNLTSFALRCR